MRIVLGSNIASLKGQRQLQNSARALERVFERLSSGQRINRASDDAAGLAISTALDSNTRVFNQGLRNINDGFSYLSVAEGGLEALKTILLRLRELATQASNGVLSDIQRGSLDEEAVRLMAEYNRIIESTSFNGRAVFSGDDSTLAVQAGYGEESVLLTQIGSTITTTTVVPDHYQADGTFAALVPFTAPSQCGSLISADFNADGYDDIATGSSTTYDLRILLSNGNGTFAGSTLVGGNFSSDGLTTADLNGDLNVDLLGYSDSSDQYVFVLLGNGNGTFASRATFSMPSSSGACDPVLSDFNGDTEQDLAIFPGNLGDSFNLYLGNGNGTFAAYTQVVAGSTITALAAGDFNGDQKSDIAAVLSSTDEVSIRLGNGNNTFGARMTFGTGNDPRAVKVGYVDTDAYLDLLVTGSDDALSVLLGAGDGTFQSRISFAAGALSFPGLVAGDFNGDDLLDAVITNETSDTLSLLVGNGNGTFKARTVLSAGDGPRDVAGGDFNNDGVLDLAAASANGGTYRTNVITANSTFIPGSSSTTTTTTGIRSITGISMATRPDSLLAQATVDSFFDDVNSVVGIIGASRSRLQVALQNLQHMSENSAAARGRILDADMAEEIAVLTRTGILQQTGAAVLAQANQQPALAIALLT